MIFMEKYRFIFSNSNIETGNKLMPKVYSCHFAFSPFKLYIFITSHDSSMAGFLGGALGYSIYKGIKSLTNKSKLKEAKDFPVTEELPAELVKKIPKFTGLIVISKDSIKEVKFSFPDKLAFYLKNGKWVRFGVNNEIKDYLYKTQWIKNI
jgi:hypothetical protein